MGIGGAGERRVVRMVEGEGCVRKGKLWKYEDWRVVGAGGGGLLGCICK